MKVNKGPSRKERKELKVLAAKDDRDIDLSDIPEVADWSDAIVGKFYRREKDGAAKDKRTTS